jgi:hypothetical protein
LDYEFYFGFFEHLDQVSSESSTDGYAIGAQVSIRGRMLKNQEEAHQEFVFHAASHPLQE